ncbi:hypothetical protein ANO14919_005430 [Xylariales sp. No.14919]|nr:hypothetical protein ANO14919_005430 [Xylariales sp. No.14919]
MSGTLDRVSTKAEFLVQKGNFLDYSPFRTSFQKQLSSPSGFLTTAVGAKTDVGVAKEEGG